MEVRQKCLSVCVCVPVCVPVSHQGFSETFEVTPTLSWCCNHADFMLTNPWPVGGLGGIPSKYKTTLKRFTAVGSGFYGYEEALTVRHTKCVVLSRESIRLAFHHLERYLERRESEMRKIEMAQRNGNRGREMGEREIEERERERVVRWRRERREEEGEEERWTRMPIRSSCVFIHLRHSPSTTEACQSFPSSPLATHIISYKMENGTFWIVYFSPV